MMNHVSTVVDAERKPTSNGVTSAAEARARGRAVRQSLHARSVTGKASHAGVESVRVRECESRCVTLL